MNWNRSVTRWLLLASVILAFSAASFAQIGVAISVRIGPPALPVYAQPICPGPGYMWTPGYWGWNDEGGYYWVPGTWVMAPMGMLWTPGYWGWGGGLYLWHAGYWGPHIGFYGGINYGYGYGGVGFYGGEWRGSAFYYNRSVTNVTVTNVTNVYTRTVVVNNTTVNNVSYNGGEGGMKAEATAQERVAEHEQHTAALETQTQHEHLASQNKQNFASENHGRPAIAATAKAGDFSNHSVIAARAAGGEYHAPAMSPKEARGPSTGSPRPAETEKSNEGFRPFTPPSKSNSTNSATSNENHPNPSRPVESRPQSESRPASRPSTPRPETHKSSPPPKQNGSKDDHHKGK